MLNSQRPDNEASEVGVSQETSTATTLDQIVQQLDTEATRWRETLAVSIGRAVALTGLKESQIRYFEELGALRPAKVSAQAGATRVYSVADLRRLRALALLLEQGHRPGEAAELVRAHHGLIEAGRALVFSKLLEHERSVVADGFLLARLVDQLIEAVQAELDQRYEGGGATFQVPTLPDRATRVARVVELILPMQPLFDEPPDDAALTRVVCQVRAQPVRMLVALRDRPTRAEDALPPKAFWPAGSDDRTVLFYSDESWELPQRTGFQYTFYAPPNASKRCMLIGIDAGDVPIEPALAIASPARTTVLDRTLALCDQIYENFSKAVIGQRYRYRSDGFPLAQTHHEYTQLLESVRQVIFPDDPGAMAVLLVPNSLDRPQTLSILASHGYNAALAQHARIHLDGVGEGLSGRAYRLREPFFSLDAARDPKVAFAFQEDCRVALAIPLATTWGIAPFGVLYLASRTPDQTLTSDVAYFGLVLCSILSELLGRWWLTRLRKEQDALLHHGLDTMIQWLDSLDQRGPDFQRGVSDVQALWKGLHAAPPRHRSGSFAFVLLDIDNYRQIQLQHTAPLPIAAQAHVRDAIRSIVPNLPSYWFGNDHAFFLLRDVDEGQVQATMRRISEVIGMPFATQEPEGSPITISVSSAFHLLSYQALLDLGGQEGEQVAAQVERIIAYLREEIQRRRTEQAPSSTPSSEGHATSMSRLTSRTAPIRR